MSAFIYEGKLPLSGIHVTKLEDCEVYKNALEITGPMIERIVAVCQTKEDQQDWVDRIRQQIRLLSQTSSPANKALSQSHGTPRSTVVSVQPPTSPAPHPPSKGWTMACLRPSPPMRPCLALGREDSSRRSGRPPKKREERSFEEDAMILNVIEAYCTSAKTRYTVNSAMLDSPQMLIAEEEKIIIEETSGNETIMEERSLVDTVYALKDQLKALETQMATLQSEVESERKARKALVAIVKSNVAVVRDDVHWPED